MASWSIMAKPARALGWLLVLAALVAPVRLRIVHTDIAFPTLQAVALGLLAAIGLTLLLVRGPVPRRALAAAELAAPALMGVILACSDAPNGSVLLFVWFAPFALLLGRRVAGVVVAMVAAALAGGYAVQLARAGHPASVSDYAGWWLVAMIAFVVVAALVDRLVQAATAAERRFAGAFVDAPLGMAIKTPRGRLLRANAALCAMFSRSEEQLRELEWRTIIEPAELPMLSEAWARMLKCGEAVSFELDFRVDGRPLRVALVESPVRDEGGTTTHVISQFCDVTAEYEARAAGARRAAQQAAVARLGQRLLTPVSLEHALELGVATIARTLDGPVACSVERTDGSRPAAAGDAAGLEPCARLEIHIGDAAPLGRLVVHRSAGSALCPDDLAFAQSVASLLTGCATRDAIERRLRHQSLHDPLTHLPNRTLLLDRLRHALALARREGTTLAILFLDMDDFKTVNDSLGHEAGDQLLREVAPRLATQLRSADSLARFGGDEFVALCEGLSSAEEAVAVAERLLGACARPVRLGTAEFFTTASIGIAVARPGYDGDPEALLRDADLAMYRAKASGPGRAELFDGEMRDQALERVALTNDLSRAVQRGELELFFQPVVCLDEGRVDGVEALLRWHHPTRGLVAPDAFIPLAEDNGRIIEIGRWVIDEAIRHAPRWPGLTVGFNVSRRQLTHDGLADDVLAAIERWGVPPRTVVMEITESALAEDPQRAGEVLERLAAAGVILALDDFGTGQSSLSSIRDFPLHTLKLDRAFLRDAADTADGWALVGAIAQMGTTLGLGIVAEGIETAAQATRLADLGCRFGQGFHFGRPVPAAEVEALVARLDADLAAARPAPAGR